jgi:thiol-disulfide isomerase/thioredoxin
MDVDNQSNQMTAHKQKIGIVLTLVVLLGVAGVITYKVVDRAKTLESDEARKIFSNDADDLSPVYTDLYGNQVDLDASLGKVVVATSWASWSPFTAADLAIQNDLAILYDGKPVTFFAVNRKESRERAQMYFATLGEMQKITVLIDSEDKFYQSIGGYAMPETVVFNADGEIVLQVRATINRDQLKQTLDALLQ